MARFDLRRKRDGLLYTNGPVPDDHYVSADWIAELLAASEVSVSVTAHFADGDQTWDLVGLQGEDGDPNRVSWHLARTAEQAPRPKKEKKEEVPSDG